MTLTSFTMEHPYLDAFVFLLIFVLVLITFAVANILLATGILEQVAIVDLILAIVGLFLVKRLGWWEKAGYNTGIRLSYVPLFILPCAVALTSLAEGIRVTAALEIFTFAVLTIVIALAEETFFRGLIFTALLPAGTFRAVIIDSFLFAALHLLNISGGTWDLFYTVTDTIAALVSGSPMPQSGYGQGVSGPLSAFTHSLILP